VGLGDEQPRRRLMRVPQAMFAGSRVVMVSCGGVHTMEEEKEEEIEEEEVKVVKVAARKSQKRRKKLHVRAFVGALVCS
jgi:hypothetical protein